MKRVDTKISILYILLFLYLIFGHIIFVDVLTLYETYLNPIIFLFLAGYTYWITRGEKGRYRLKNDKVQTIFILILIYLIIYFASGLVLGYVKSPYAHDLLSIFKNSWAFLTVIIFEEYIRAILVGYTKKRKYLYVLIVILFTLFEINFYQIGTNFGSGEMAFKYISSTVFPALVRNILFTYLALEASCMASLTYRLPLALTRLVLPILPNLNWFLIGISESILPLFVYLFLNRMNEEKYIRHRRKSSFKEIPFTICFLFIIFFIVGFFKYKPVSIMSNSMAPLIQRGDAVIIEKVGKNLEDLSVHDIIEYNLDGFQIIHRIVAIDTSEDGTKRYRTKGDYNHTVDEKWVSSNQITGIIRFKIPKIGYPAVWLNEMFQSSKPDVETPK